MNLFPPATTPTTIALWLVTWGIIVAVLLHVLTLDDIDDDHQAGPKKPRAQDDEIEPWWFDHF